MLCRWDKPKWDRTPRTRGGVVLKFCLLLWFAQAGANPVAVEPASGSAHTAIDGAALFADHCLICHAIPGPWPNLAGISRLDYEQIYHVITGGLMRELASGLNDAEHKSIAHYAAGLNPDKPSLQSGGLCRDGSSRHAHDAGGGAAWRGWSNDAGNNRSVADAGITRSQVAGLRLKWSFVFPDTAPFTTAAGNQPTVANGRLYVGSVSGMVYALDAATGCTLWSYQAKTHVQGAVAVADNLVVFADYETNVYGLDAKTGGLRWINRADEQPSARVNASVTVFDGVAFVPVSSNQEFATSVNPLIPCCSFQGKIAAFDVATGRQLWKTYLIDEPLRELGLNNKGVKRYGPSGAAVWSAPTIDARRGVLYVTTGNQYTEPHVSAADAVIALDLKTGKKRWSKSYIPEEFGGKDIWNGGCIGLLSGATPTCPPDNPSQEGDREFGAPVVLKTLADGNDVLLAGSKDGVIYALDPDRQGHVLWQIRLSKIAAGRGPILGGIEHGLAVDDAQIYAPIADMDPVEMTAFGNMVSVDLKSGTLRWEAPAAANACSNRPLGCNNAYMGAPTVAGGFLFAGSNDGVLRAFDTNDGRIVWSFDSVKEFVGVNGLRGRGGSLTRSGPAIVNGMLYQTSGYGHLTVGMPGNVLLAFELPKQ